MRLTESPAWNILTTDEKTALSLSISLEKSTWEAGEIMKKSHYKYLEIQQRANQFAKMFSKHYNKYDALVPPGISIELPFHDFLTFAIEKRKTISEVYSLIESSKYPTKYEKTRMVVENLRRLGESKGEAELDLFNIIHEFDRWNNFRILPSDIQMPSAFKRRNKARFNKHLKNIKDLSEFSSKAIISKTSYKGKLNKFYVMLLTSWDSDNHYQVYSVKDETRIIDFLSSCGVFMFKEKKEAIEFGELVTSFLGMGVKTCIDGQRFWPEFRVKASQAINYRQIENIVPSKKHLKMSTIDEDKAIVKKRTVKAENKKHETPGEKRIKKSSLWY